MSITALPLELCGMVESYLPNRDIKNLRLVSRDFLNKFPLRLYRLFLSANTLNIEVFRSIADHETFRHHVVEIIWDDSLLAETSTRSLYGSLVDLRSSRYVVVDDPALNWYDIAAAALTFDENWDYYRKLLGQQREAIKSEVDIEALKYGLERFPALRRVTMTSDAHGFLFAPKYETPMIRSFPYGFNYPIPNGWPYRDKDIQSERNLTQEQATAKEAMGALPQPESRWPRVLHQLATLEHHHITELLVQSHEKRAAFQTRRFRTQAEEDTYLAGWPLQWRGEYHALNPRTDYERPGDFEALLSRPGLRRLEVLFQLKLSPYSEYNRMAGRFHSCRHTALKWALEEATDLEHFHIRFQINGFSRVFDLRDWNYLYLDVMLPHDRWPKLQHFGLEIPSAL
ncbi:hypothetical protein KJ359_007276 [Pestalotiopsis sp. 9143b]|nr:hypothetical protein KJ359_007276 [Pestalotiopsis sp. 9143b]